MMRTTACGRFCPAPHLFLAYLERLDGFSLDCIASIAHLRGRTGPRDYQFAQEWKYMVGGKPGSPLWLTILLAVSQPTVELSLWISKEARAMSTSGLQLVNLDFLERFILCQLKKEETHELMRLCSRKGLTLSWKRESHALCWIAPLWSSQ